MNSPIPYQLRVGVTGHRDLIQPDEVRVAVEHLLDRINLLLAQTNARPAKPARFWKLPAKWIDRVLVRVAHAIFPQVPISPRVFPEATHTPIQWVVVSALARGADRIVAQAAMDRKRASLEVVLPMSADEYRKDFTEPGDLEEFDTLLARSSHQCIVPPHGADASTDPDARNDAYLAGGKAVVDASEILIAIWDGKPASAKGGTGDIVEYALHSNKMVLWIDCNAPAKPVRRLLSDTKITGERLDWKPAPMPATGRELSSAFHCLAAYNRDPAFDPNAWAAHVESARTEFAKAADHAGVPQGPQRPALDTLIPQYARADLLALRYQRLHEGSTQWLFILAAGAVSAAVAQTFFLPDYAWTIFFEVAVLAAILALLRISRAEDWHDKWLHDRHLAEHLRTRMYLSVLGEPPSRAARPAIELLPFYEGPSRWVQSAIDEIEAEVPAAIRTPAELHSIRKFLAAGWIRDQANYHHSNSKKKQRRSRAIHRLGTGVYLITIAAATLHAFGIGGHGDGSHSPFQIGKAISVLTILLPVWVANLHAINNLLERDRIATRSSRMAGLLGQLAREMESTHNDQETYEIAQRAALVMASENHEWVVSLSFRGPVLPA